MKKLLCLVLLVSMLSLSVVAFADQTYTGDGYSFRFPDTWTFGADQDGAEFVLMMSDGNSNINMVYQDLGMKLTAEQVDQLLMPLLIQQYQDTFENVSFTEMDSPVVLGDNAYSVLGFYVTIFGMDRYMEQYIILNDKIAYIFTVTYVSEDASLITDAQYMLSTLQFD